MDERTLRDGFLQYLRQRVLAKRQGQEFAGAVVKRPEATEEPRSIHAAYEKKESPSGGNESVY